MGKEKINKIFFTAVASFALAILFSPVIAGEKIIKEEEISFKKCLDIINVSADKLSIAPELIAESNKKHIAIFSLSDGTLKIVCDGEKNLVIVSTNDN